jgi:hypothetical protein
MDKLTLPYERVAPYELRGRYRADIATAGTTVVAARTTTAGFLAQFRWDPTDTTIKAYVRYVGARFLLTTAYGAAQQTGCDLIVGRSATVACTGGSALDLGGTLTGSGKRRTDQPASLAEGRIGTTGALTAGTQTLDANPVGVLTAWSAAVGDTVPLVTQGGPAYGTLWDSRESGDHLLLSNDETLIIRNLILMGATGVGNWYFAIEWDEGIPNGGAS